VRYQKLKKTTAEAALKSQHETVMSEQNVQELERDHDTGRDPGVED